MCVSQCFGRTRRTSPGCCYIGLVCWLIHSSLHAYRVAYRRHNCSCLAETTSPAPRTKALDYPRPVITSDSHQGNRPSKSKLRGGEEPSSAFGFSKLVARQSSTQSTRHIYIFGRGTVSKTLVDSSSSSCDNGSILIARHHRPRSDRPGGDCDKQRTSARPLAASSVAMSSVAQMRVSCVLPPLVHLGTVSSSKIFVLICSRRNHHSSHT